MVAICPIFIDFVTIFDWLLNYKSAFITVFKKTTCMVHQHYRWRTDEKALCVNLTGRVFSLGKVRRKKIPDSS